VAVALLITTLLHVGWLYYIRQRIAFTSVLLTSVAQVLHNYPATIVLALGSLCVQLLVLLLWSFAAL